MSAPEFDAGFLHLAKRQQPDERFIVEIDDLDAVAPRIAEIAAEAFDQLQSIPARQLLAHLRDLRIVAHHDSEVPICWIRDHSLALKHGKKLVFAEFEKGVAFAFVEFF
jgi:hypothetical protein